MKRSRHDPHGVRGAAPRRGLPGASAILLLVIALASLFFGHGRAHADLVVCNNYDYNISYVMVFDERAFPDIAGPWRAMGWYVLAPGECRDAVVGGSGGEVLLSVLGETTKGNYTLLRFPPVPFVLDRSISGGTEQVYCVSGEPFDYALDSLSDHVECYDGYYLQLFNLYANVLPNTSFTIRLH